jgi:hypothetical protein
MRGQVEGDPAGVNAAAACTDKLMLAVAEGVCAKQLQRLTPSQLQVPCVESKVGLP